MPLFQSLLIAVALALCAVFISLRARWATSHWRSEQLKPVLEIDDLVKIISGLDRRASRRGDPRSLAITEWVKPLRPMIDKWAILKRELLRQASLTAWLRAGMPKELAIDYRSATLQLHARSAVTPILSQFNAGPVELGPALSDDLWRALDVDLPEPSTQTIASPILS